MKWGEDGEGRGKGKEIEKKGERGSEKRGQREAGGLRKEKESRGDEIWAGAGEGGKGKGQEIGGGVTTHS